MNWYKINKIAVLLAILIAASEGIAGSAIRTPLAAPTGFMVERIKQNNDYMLKFTWEKVPGAKTYRFYQKSHHAGELAQLCAVSGNSYTMKYPAQFDTQIWSFGIAAEPPNDDNMYRSSELALIKDIKLVVANLKPVTNLIFDVNLDSILLRWKNSEPSVTKFEILLNGKKMLTLPYTAWEALLTDVDETMSGKGKNGILEVAVVSSNDLGSAVTKKYFFFRVPDSRQKAIPMIDKFQAEAKGKSVIELSWEKVNNTDGILLQYEIPSLDDRGILIEKTYKKGDVSCRYTFQVPEKAGAGTKIIFKISALRILQTGNSLPALPGAWTAHEFIL